MLVKKISREKTCFQTGGNQMLFTNIWVCRPKRWSIRVVTWLRQVTWRCQFV